MDLSPSGTSGGATIPTRPLDRSSAVQLHPNAEMKFLSRIADALKFRCPRRILFSRSCQVRKQPWVVLPPNTPAVAEYYERTQYWPKESLERRAALLAGRRGR